MVIREKLYPRKFIPYIHTRVLSVPVLRIRLTLVRGGDGEGGEEGGRGERGEGEGRGGGGREGGHSDGYMIVLFSCSVQCRNELFVG